MKLTIAEFRPLVSSPKDISKHLATLQSIEALDLSNGGIVGDQIAGLLQFISLSPSPVALRSVDLGHNRLGDAGTIALAQLLQASASKLPNLESLDLFENGIRRCTGARERYPRRSVCRKPTTADECDAARQRHLRDGSSRGGLNVESDSGGLSLRVETNDTAR